MVCFNLWLSDSYQCLALFYTGANVEGAKTNTHVQLVHIDYVHQYAHLCEHQALLMVLGNLLMPPPHLILPNNQSLS